MFFVFVAVDEPNCAIFHARRVSCDHGPSLFPSMLEVAARYMHDEVNDRRVASSRQETIIKLRIDTSVSMM